MSCAYPVKVKNPSYMKLGNNLSKQNTQKYFYVPCGKCLGCMIAKRKWLKKACEYEFNKYGCGAFVTLTYDDEHLDHLWSQEDKNFILDYRDFQLFMKRLRRNLEYKYKTKIDWKYLVVGEYGDKFGRPHMHMLIFGLDCVNNKEDIYKAWENGEIQSDPIKTGAMSYVLKYMDKNEHRNRKNLEQEDFRKPFIKYSKGLGKQWVEENLSELHKNHGMYKSEHGRMDSLPSYYMNKYRIKPIQADLSEVRKEMVKCGYRRERRLKDGSYVGVKVDENEITMNEVRRWEFEKAQIKEKALITKSRAELRAQEDFNEQYSEGIKNEMYGY